jgi:intracellular septation protein
MRQLFASSKLLLLDMASTFLFLAVFLLTGSIPLSVGLGMALGVAQVGWEFARVKPIDVMQWMLKPTIIYCVVGVVMLRRGWMNRYLPPAAVQWVPDVAIVFGYAWAGLMFLSAALNLIAATSLSVAAWAAFMSVWAVGSKVALFLISYATMRYIGIRRHRAQMYPALP